MVQELNLDGCLAGRWPSLATDPTHKPELIMKTVSGLFQRANEIPLRLSPEKAAGRVRPLNFVLNFTQYHHDKSLKYVFCACEKAQPGLGSRSITLPQKATPISLWRPHPPFSE
jgi:hypothetical protein